MCIRDSFYINGIYENEMEEESMMTLETIMANMTVLERESIMDKMVKASRDILETIEMCIRDSCSASGKRSTAHERSDGRSGYYVAGKATVNFVFDRYMSLKNNLKPTTKSNYLYMYDRFMIKNVIPRDFAIRISRAAHSRTCPTLPAADESASV